MGIEKETQATGETIDLHAARQASVDVVETVGESERQFLDRGRAGLADVIAADANGVPLRHMFGTELDHIAHQPDVRLRRENKLVLGMKLLEDVVLNRAAEFLPIHA